MNPFYFGDTGNALYGVHHPPRGSTSRASGVVLCYPFAQEYMRAHRAFRQLSLLLSGEGFHTLRFDYSGTGDSSGEPADMSLAGLDENLATAIEELIDAAGVESVWLVGLRLGAAIALRAATRTQVAGVVLWDPVVVGSAQLDGAHAARNGTGARVVELGGVPISSGLQNDLHALDLSRTPIPRHLSCLVAVSDDAPRYRGLCDRLTRDGAEVTYQCVPGDGRWSEFDNWGSALIPQALIKVIVDYLKLSAK